MMFCSFLFSSAWNYNNFFVRFILSSLLLFSVLLKLTIPHIPHNTHIQEGLNWMREKNYALRAHTNLPYNHATTRCNIIDIYSHEFCSLMSRHFIAIPNRIEEPKAYMLLYIYTNTCVFFFLLSSQCNELLQTQMHHEHFLFKCLVEC